MKKTYILPILLVFILSCEKEKTTLLINENPTPKVYTAKSKDIIKNPVNKTEILLSDILNKKETVKNQLTGSTKLQANKLYDAFYAETEILMGKLTDSEIDLLGKFYNEDAKTKSLIKNKKEELEKYGLEFDEIGEGYVEIKTKPDYYFEIFKDYVSDDYREYLEITNEENKQLYSADAGLMISFKELGDRIGVWENFIAKYPKTSLLQKLKEDYKYYQQDYLFGMDNTPTIERADPANLFIYPENIDEFSRFKKKYPKSPTNKLIDIFLQNFKNDNVHDIIQKEQAKS